MPEKVRDVHERLERDGWVCVRSKGSHFVFKRPGTREQITFPGKQNDELAIGTYRRIAQIAGWID